MPRPLRPVGKVLGKRCRREYVPNEQWAKRCAAARDLAEHSAGPSEFFAAARVFCMQPGLDFAHLMRELGFRLCPNDMRFLGVLCSVLRTGVRGVWVKHAYWQEMLNECDEKTVRNIVDRLVALDLVRRVPMYRPCGQYQKRGRHYSQLQEANVYTLGFVGRQALAPVVLRWTQQSELVENLYVPDEYLTRESFPGNMRSKVGKDLLRLRRHLSMLAFAQYVRKRRSAEKRATEELRGNPSMAELRAKQVAWDLLARRNGASPTLFVAAHGPSCTCVTCRPARPQAP